jgi:hypothetical protein
MALSDSVEKVLRLVKETSGLPVHVEPDSTLPPNIFSKVTKARGAMPFHRIGYQLSASATPDYLIVNQCGFLLRSYAVPARDRFDFTATDFAEATVRQWVLNNSKTPNLPAHVADGLTVFLFDGILSQLRSVPVGLRVDAWILAEYPDLAPLQRQAVFRQLDDNAAALRPDVMASMPDQALDTSIAMNAAFALYWAEKLKQAQIALPYQAAGRLDVGRQLLDIWKNIADDPAQDIELIDTWADKLNLAGWYRWVKQAAS